MHVATTKRTYRGTVYVTHLLRRSIREGGKVKHQTLGNLSHLPPDLIGTIRQRLSGEMREGQGPWEIVRSLPHGHVAAVLGMLRQIGLEGVLASRPSRERSLVMALIVMRLIAPQSKLATCRGLKAETATTSLTVELELGAPSEEELYKALDWLLTRQTRIETKLARRHLQDGTLVLYDVSSSYYTGHRAGLVQFGYNRDGKNGFPQIVYGLLCNTEGCPVAIEVFEGNTADPKTLGPQIEKLRRRFDVKRVVLVGDRGMITGKRIDESLRGVEGLDWITALRADSIQRLASQGLIQQSLFDERDLVEITSPDYPGERLMVCRNPLLADERARKRKELLSSENTVRAYKDLAKVERAFRSMKTIDLHVRPIYHWLDARIKAHVFLCMLAYYVEWHMRKRLAAVLFDDHERESAEASRKSIVAPAPRSAAALRKDFAKRTDADEPVHSFRTLLADLGTLCKNRVRLLSDPAAEFYQHTRATPPQQRAFELLGVEVPL